MDAQQEKKLHVVISQYKKENDSCECCGEEGRYRDNFCNKCIINEYGDQSVQAKRRGIGMFQIYQKQ